MKIFLFFIALVTYANTQRPPRPLPGVDNQMVKMVQERLEKGEKKEELAKASQAYRNAKTALENKRAQGAKAEEIDAFSEKMIRAERKQQLELVEKHGPCMTQPVTYSRQEDKNFDRHWYTSNGFCVFNGRSSERKNREEAEKSFSEVFDRLTTHLKTPARYKKKLDGYNYILEYLRVDRKGNALSEKDQQSPVKEAQFDAFIAIPTPVSDPFNSLALSYYFRGRIDEKQANQFTLLFDSLEEQPRVQHPVYYGASGTGMGDGLLTQNLIRMRSVTGGWYLRWDPAARRGIMQYFTQADFSLPMRGAEDYARGVLGDTILTLYEKARDFEALE